MSKLIKVLECRKCGAELYRKEEGEYRNSNGTWSSNTQVFKIDEKYCSHCTGKLNEYINEDAKKHFKGKCPYTDKKCEDWRCQNCEVEAAERKYMENDSEE